MNDPQSTPEAAIDDTAFDQKQRDYARRSEEIRTANKAVLFDSLAAAGIETPSSLRLTAMATAARSKTSAPGQGTQPFRCHPTGSRSRA